MPNPVSKEISQLLAEWRVLRRGMVMMRQLYSVPDVRGGLLRLTTILAHSSGEWVSSEWPVC